MIAGTRNSNPVRRRAGCSCPTIPPVEVVLTVICRRGEDLVDAAGREPDPASGDPALGQAARDPLHRERSSFAPSRERENLAHDARLLVVDDEDFLLLSLASLGNLGLVARRAGASRSKTLGGRSRTSPDEHAWRSRATDARQRHSGACGTSRRSGRTRRFA
jgi:hypothetical protein